MKTIILAFGISLILASAVTEFLCPRNKKLTNYMGYSGIGLLLVAAFLERMGW